MESACIRFFIAITIALMTVNCSLDARIYGVVDSSTSKEVQSPSDGNPSQPITGSINFVLPSTYLKTQGSVNIVPIKTDGCSDFLVSPPLPNGLSINFNTGVITGTPIAATTKQSYTVSAKDANGKIITAQIEFEVAKYFLVNTLNDTSDALLGNGVCADSIGYCSIRAALEEAKALGANSLSYIEIPLGDYGVDNAYLSIDSRVIIKGAGSSSVNLIGNKDGSSISNIITISSTADDVTIEGVTIKNASISSGTGVYSGLGIKSFAKNLTLQDCVIKDNTISVASINVVGIGLVHNSTGDLKISNCLITNNVLTTASTFAQGAGIGAVAKNIFIDNSVISSNLLPTASGTSDSGGATLTASNLISIESSTITGNQARNRAAGMTLSGKTIINNSTLKNNIGPVNIFGNELYLSGAYTYDMSNSLLQLTTGQQAIYVNGATLNIINSTVSTAAIAVYNTNAQTNFQSSTLVVGTAPAFAFPGSNTTGNVSFKNSIIKFTGSYHVGATNPSYSSLGYNVFSNSGLPVGTNAATDLLSTDPVLLGLANNGGPTLTMALSTDQAIPSQAINLIPVSSCLSKDQRGQSRTAGTFCDAGAYQH